LIDRALYLPESWTKDPERCREAEVPEGTTFKTKSQLGQELLERAFEYNLPIAWVTGDEVYGKDGKLRRWLEQQEHRFVLAVAANHYVWVGFEQLTVSQLPIPGWHRLSAGSGSKGPRLYDWFLIPVNGFADNPDWHRWILIRRSLEKPDELVYYAVSAPAETTLEEMIQVAGTCWTIEECFEMAKNMDRLVSPYHALHDGSGLSRYRSETGSGKKGVSPPVPAPKNGQPASLSATASTAGNPTTKPLPLTVSEVRKLLAWLVWGQQPLQPPHVIHWSRWRRRHQFIAKFYHYKTRASLG
jgi:hypothetical protein